MIKFLYEEVVSLCTTYLWDGTGKITQTGDSIDIENVSENVIKNGNDFAEDIFISGIIKGELEKFKKENLDEFDYGFEVYMPWNRLFEIGIEVKKD